MFKDDYKDTFSKVTASEETYRRVLNMRRQRKTYHRGGVIGKVLIAAAILSTMVLTVSAAEFGWFQGYFEGKSEEPMSPAQVEFIEANEQSIDLTIIPAESPSGEHVENGYTLRVKSVLTDGTMAYITIGVTGPEDAVLSKTVIEGYNPAAPSIQPGNWAELNLFQPAEGEVLYGSSIESCEDHDGRDNTQDLLLTIKPDLTEGELPFAPGRVWKLHIQDLIAVYQNDAYIREMDEQHNGDEYFEWSKEAAPQVVLATGTWDFDITFADTDQRSIELIQEPIVTNANMDWDVYKDVTITSFSLTPLSAIVRTDDLSSIPDFTRAATGEHIYAVLNDGSQIQLRAKPYVSLMPGQQQLEAVGPIPLDEVDHILLADGTKLPMP